MSLPKLIIAGVFTVSTMGLTTTAYANETVSCLDGSVENGDCILRNGSTFRDWDGARGASNNEASEETANDDDDDDDDNDDD
ncbi:MAG: hypothetical protein AAFN63_05280 [Pseudomonadota bacterium]